MKKNILFILADQLRADFCGCYGATCVETPNIDKLANDGVLYRQALSPSPICVPARASLMTGKNAIENRVTYNNHWLRPDHDEMGDYTFAKKLTDAGYYTAGIGKMHFYPWDIKEGFEHRVIAEDKRHVHIEDDYSLFLRKNGYKRLRGSEQQEFYEYLGAIISEIPEKYQIDRFVCDETKSCLNTIETVGRPFAMMVGFPGPHCPYDPAPEVMEKTQIKKQPEAYPCTATIEPNRKENVKANKGAWNGIDLDTITPEKNEKVRQHYSALVGAIDGYIGEIVETLKEKGLYDNTVIILSSDHGDFLGDYGMHGKRFFYESATRIPIIVKDTENTKQVVEHAVSLTDIHNTILHFANVDYQDTSDNTTLAPFGKVEKRAPIFGCLDLGWMVRDDSHLYTEYQNGVIELYDIVKDPAQQKNLVDIQEYAQKVKEMRKIMMANVFSSINKGNSDMIARYNSKNPETGIDPFNYEGWKRPYPYKA